MIQVHLIPFNNYTPYVGIEQYKYQLRMMQASIDPYNYDDYDIPDENDGKLNFEFWKKENKSIVCSIIGEIKAL